MVGYTDNDEDHFIWKPHLYIDKDWIVDKITPIRIAGGTVGCIEIDENQITTKIAIDPYDEEVNKKINEMYVGTKVEL